MFCAAFLSVVLLGGAEANLDLRMKIAEVEVEVESAECDLLSAKVDQMKSRILADYYTKRVESLRTLIPGSVARKDCEEAEMQRDLAVLEKDRDTHEVRKCESRLRLAKIRMEIVKRDK